MLLKVVCLPAKDAADELGCEIFAQLLPGYTVQVLSGQVSTDDLVREIAKIQANVVCIAGVPPQATRHVAVRCRHLRRLCPDIPIMAAVWSDADLSSIRSRIPVSEANHVVCTLKQAVEYVSDIANPISPPNLPSETEDSETAQRISALELLDTANTPLQKVLDQIVQDVAKALNAPIAILTVTEETGEVWKSHSGLPPDLASGLEGIERMLETSVQKEKSRVVIEDIAKDERFGGDLSLNEKGIHSCVAEPLLNGNGKLVGAIMVLDTRTRKISSQEQDLLRAGAEAALGALEVRAVAPPPETRAEPSLDRE